MSGLFVHIGMAKAASTSVQATIARLPGVVNAGYDPAYVERRWYRAELGEFFDRTLRFSDDARFAAEAPPVRAFLAALAAEAPASALASENLTVRFIPNDLPTDIKLKRLATLLPATATLFLVHRPTRSLLASFYKEYLLMGDDRDFERFVSDAIRYRAVNFFDDLLLGRLLGLLDDVFGLARVRLCPAESARIAATLAELSGCEVPELPQRNPSMSDAEAIALARANREAHAPVAFEALIEKHRAFNADPAICEDDKFALNRARKARAAGVTGAEGGGPLTLSAELEGELDAIVRKDQVAAQALGARHSHIAAGLE